MLTRCATGIAVRFLAAVLAVIVSLPGSPALAEQVDLPPDLAAKIAALLPSIAAINTTASTPQGSTFFEGSGFVIDPSGLLLTNRHVIQGAYEITVTLPNLPPMTAKAAYISQRLDLAILKVNAGRKLPALKLGDSDPVKVGDRVLLVGNALGLRTALSAGVISAVNCDIGDTMYDHFFQTDAALNHGNSGGPMFDMKGEVIGIDTALISPTTGSVGVGFAIPINDASFVVNQYLRTGEVSVGTLGLRAQRVTDDLAKAFGLKSVRGAIVTEVDPKGPTFGKVQFGDVILRINGRDVSDLPAMARLVATSPNGRVLQLDLLRGEKELSVGVPVRRVVVDEKMAMTVLGHAPPERTAFATPSNTGMLLAPVDAQVRARYGLNDEEQGVVVVSLDPSSAAAKRQIKVGEVIERIGDHAVTSSNEVQAALQAIAGQHATLAPLLVRGPQGPRWIVLPLEPG